MEAKLRNLRRHPGKQQQRDRQSGRHPDRHRFWRPPELHRHLSKDDNTNTKSFSKTVTLLKSETDLTSDGAVTTYNGDTPTDRFTYGDTITVKAKPTATGTAASPARLRAALNGPSAGQMAVFAGDTQVSDPVPANADGIVGTDAMADGVGTVDVTLQQKTVTPKLVRSPDPKVYDGTKNYQVNNSLIALDGVLDGDEVIPACSGQLNSADAGTRSLTITVTGLSVGAIRPAVLQLTVRVEIQQFMLSLLQSPDDYGNV